ncbi:MAG: SHOCT domain-containing protein [Solirubrobacteraceae bacterium]
MIALAAWRPRRQTAATTPLETLQGRYARGDIDAQEFDRRRQALGARHARIRLNSVGSRRMS